MEKCQLAAERVVVREIEIVQVQLMFTFGYWQQFPSSVSIDEELWMRLK